MKLINPFRNRGAYVVIIGLVLIILYLLLKNVASLGYETISKDSQIIIHPSTENIFVIDSFDSPLIYHYNNNEEGQISFESIITDRLKIKLIPNNKTRRDNSISSIANILGVTHFFLDLDLSSHFVHPYTINFFKKLRPTDFVLKFDADVSDPQVGIIHYVHKNTIDSSDRLGYDLALFRQWRLSEVIHQQRNGDVELYMNPCSFSSNCDCPQVDNKSSNPFPKEVPLWNEQNVSGYSSLSNFRKLNHHNGGTVVIIWEDTANQKIFFCDIHGSTYDIFSRAIDISKKYSTDPTIAISDAGPMANKFLSDGNHVLDCNKISSLLSYDFVGAGFGYVPQKIYKYARLKDGTFTTFTSLEKPIK